MSLRNTKQMPVMEDKMATMSVKKQGTRKSTFSVASKMPQALRRRKQAKEDEEFLNEQTL